MPPTMRKHESSHLPPAFSPWACFYCGATFRTWHCAEVHGKRHHGCGGRYATARELADDDAQPPTRVVRSPATRPFRPTPFVQRPPTIAAGDLWWLHCSACPFKTIKAHQIDAHVRKHGGEGGGGAAGFWRRPRNRKGERPREGVYVPFVCRLCARSEAVTFQEHAAHLWASHHDALFAPPARFCCATCRRVAGGDLGVVLRHARMGGCGGGEEKGGERKMGGVLRMNVETGLYEPMRRAAIVEELRRVKAVVRVTVKKKNEVIEEGEKVVKADEEGKGGDADVDDHDDVDEVEEEERPLVIDESR